jgi:hypothetical protein
MRKMKVRKSTFKGLECFEITEAPIRTRQSEGFDDWYLADGGDHLTAIYPSRDGEDYEEKQADFTQGGLVMPKTLFEKVAFMRRYVEERDREEASWAA